MVLITYNEAIDDEVMETLQAHSVEGYTKWTKVLGKGRTSGPHLLTHVWPKANNVLAIAIEDERAKHLLADVEKLKQTVRQEGLKAFLLNLEGLV